MATFTADEAAATAPAKGEGFSGNAKVVVSEEHTSELQSRLHLVCRLLLGKKKRTQVMETSRILH